MQSRAPCLSVEADIVLARLCLAVVVLVLVEVHLDEDAVERGDGGYRS